ncbi:hypothetical protein SAMN05216389_11747 [Oceanobacillus limi]|uniref:Uncharacterized protein n=1 Tax=Oceanobacillus limi TaxID=930131 RepID=A0A1I0FVR5_9BACI|nr:hypothetical protein [Oceanobacillus limi]SET61757.1 hypothetical protein SAMN05216389_11747 [Oceanobacillus limi]
MRSIVVLLLLVVFFLAGTLFGINRGDIALLGEDKQEVGTEEMIGSHEVKDEMEGFNEEEAETSSNQDITTDSIQRVEQPVNFTQKTASFLEGAVKVFYEGLVQILYQISQLFY